MNALNFRTELERTHWSLRTCLKLIGCFLGLLKFCYSHKCSPGTELNLNTSPRDIVEMFHGFATNLSASDDDLEKMKFYVQVMDQGSLMKGRAIGLFQVEEVLLYEQENARFHNTLPFNIIYGAHPSAVLRRGFPFKVGIRFNQEVDLSQTNIKIFMQLGVKPNVYDGSFVILQVPNQLETEETSGTSGWSILLKLQERNMLLLHVTSPPTTAVGEWTMGIQLDNDEPGTVNQRIYILYNPWNKDDAVFMDDSQLRLFYVMKSVAYNYQGTVKNHQPKRWYYGQFDKISLPTVEYLLRHSTLTNLERGSHVLVVRALTAMANSPDDNGVLYGRWSGSYEDGTNPMYWSSCTPMMKQYMETSESVRYAQCFCFAALLNTLLRAIGVPSRTVANFPCLHDSDGDGIGTFFFDENEKPITFSGADIEWNYHQWTEAWMTRPDLPDGYNGWQVLDATPQVQSTIPTHGRFKFVIGPFPVKAVLEEQLHLMYDGHYVFSEVRARYRFYKRNRRSPTREFQMVSEQEGTTAQLIVTETLNFEGNRVQEFDITNTYKITGPRARTAAEKAVRLSLIFNKTIPVGSTIHVTCLVKNADSKAHKVQITLMASSVSYDNSLHTAVGRESREYDLSARAEASFQLAVKPDFYLGRLYPSKAIRLYAIASFEDNISVLKDILTVTMPKLKVKILSRERPEGKLIYMVTLKNPLKIALTACRLLVDLPGITASLVPKAIPDVPAGQTMTKRGALYVNSQDTTSLVVTFISRELPQVTATKDF